MSTEKKYKQIIKGLKEKPCKTKNDILMNYLQDESTECFTDLQSFLDNIKNKLLIFKKTFNTNNLNNLIKFLNDNLDDETKIILYGGSDFYTIQSYIIEKIKSEEDYDSEYWRILKTIEENLKNCYIIRRSLETIKEVLSCSIEN